jgi:GTP cyclohydrolase I
MQIHNALKDILGDSLGIAVVIEAKHTCVSHRGIGQGSTMKTSKLSGVFLNKDDQCRQEFYQFIKGLD